jgi:hypothetical protein
MNNWLDKYENGGSFLGTTNVGRDYSPAWGGQFDMGGNIPGSVGFTYARTGDIPSNGKYAKKTLASAQNGKEMQFYQEGLDFQPKTISQDGTRVAPRPRALTEAEYQENKRISEAQKIATEKHNKQILEERQKARNTKGTFKEKNFNIGEKFRMFPGSVGGAGELFDDYINPLKFVGDMASNLGNSRTPQEAALNVAMTAGLGAIGFDPLGSALKSPALKRFPKQLEVPKPTSVSSSVDDVVQPITPQSWQIQELPGLHLKSTMSNNPQGLHKYITKNGSIDTKSALDHLKRMEGDVKYDVVLQNMKKKYGSNLENMPKRMDYNILRKDIQDGLWDIGTGKGQQVDLYSGLDMKKFGIIKEEEPWLHGPTLEPRHQPSLGYTTDEVILDGYSFSNKNKFIGGSNAHNMPEETLGHSRGFTNPKEPGVYYSAERQSNWAQEANNTTDPISPGTVKRKDIHERLLRNEKYLKESIKEQDDLIAAGNDTWAISQKERLQSQLKGVQETISQNNKYINASPQEKLVMKNIHERMLQEDVARAASMGNTKYRLPSEESMATIQGWKPLQKKTQLDRYKQDLEYLKTENGFQKLGLDDIVHREDYGTGRLSKVPITKKEYLDLTNKKIKELESLGEAELNKHYYTDPQSTILKHTSQSLKDSEKLFGVKLKPVTDIKGNSWYEFDIPKKFKEGKGEIKAFSTIGAVVGGASAFGMAPLEQKKQGGVIKDDRGQWAHPGQITEIDSNDITMQGVPYPVLGIGADGEQMMMQPGEDYKFNKGPVTEYPMMKSGGNINNLDAQPIEKLDQLTNFTNYNKPTKGGWLDKYQ